MGNAQTTLHPSSTHGSDPERHGTKPIAHKELAAYSRHVEQAALASRLREETINTLLQTFASDVNDRFDHLEANATILRNLLLVSLVLLLVGMVAYLQ